MSERGHPTILLTGFGPFPGAAVNASAALVEELSGIIARRFSSKRVVWAILPTEWSAAPRNLARLYSRERPTHCIHFGVSAKAKTLVVETRADNNCRLSADAKGALPKLSCIDPDGPECLNVSLPVQAIVSRLENLDVPVRLSGDAGSYLCNTVLYRSLQLASLQGHPARAGFIHMPIGLDGAPSGIPSAPDHPALTWAQALAGGVEIVRTVLGTPAAVRSQR